MGLQIQNVFDKKTGKCTHINSLNGKEWFMPDGTPTTLPNEPDSKVKTDSMVYESFLMLIAGIVLMVCFFFM